MIGRVLLAAGAALVLTCGASAQEGSGEPHSYVDTLVERAKATLAADGAGRDPALAAAMLQDAARAGSAVAKVELADLYRRGDGVAADRVRAEELLVQAIDAGAGPAAQLALGALYDEPGPTRRPGAAAAAFGKAAEAGSAEAMLRLAALQLAGDGVVAEPMATRALVLRAIAAGAVFDGAKLLGDSYAGGPDRNPFAAALAYQAAARAGNPDAMVRLATMLMRGDGFAPNVVRARFLLDRAIAAGAGAEAFEALGDLHLLGREFADGNDAVAAYSEAATRGSTAAMLKLAHRLLEAGGEPTAMERAYSILAEAVSGGAGVEVALLLGDLARRDGPSQNLRIAADAYRAAARLESTRALVALARMTAAGEGVEASRNEAIRLAKEAADIGDVFFGASALGDILAEGAAPGDMALALQAYEQAGNAGNRAAMLAMARILAEGEGVPRDLDRARAIIERAVAAGNEAEAWKALGDIMARPDTGFHDPQAARAAYEQAAAQGYVPAYVPLGNMLLEDVRSTDDIRRARVLLEAAYATGREPLAAEGLGRLALLDAGPVGDKSRARALFEVAAAAGSGAAHLEAGELAANDHPRAGGIATAVDHFRSGAATEGSERSATRLMRLPEPALVAVLQQLLTTAGHRTAVDGDFGRSTGRAVERYCAEVALANCPTAFVTIDVLASLLSRDYED